MPNSIRIEDLLNVGGDVLHHLAEARHALKSHVKGGAEHVARKLDLVSREEFDVAFAMLKKARARQEEIESRLNRIESILNLSSDSKVVKTKKQNLPSVKTKKKRRKVQGA